jgi:hypothetical protein
MAGERAARFGDETSPPKKKKDQLSLAQGVDNFAFARSSRPRGAGG